MRGRRILIIRFPLQFSNFLISCQVAKVCVLHKGFHVLVESFPSILTSAM